MDERLQGGQLLEEPKLLHFRGNTFSLQISVLDIPPFLWRIKPFTACQVPARFVSLHLNSEEVPISTGRGITQVRQGLFCFCKALGLISVASADSSTVIISMRSKELTLLNLMQVAQSKVGIKFIAASYKQKGESQKREAGATGEGESAVLVLSQAQRGRAAAGFSPSRHLTHPHSSHSG